MRPRVGERRSREVRSQAILGLSRTRLMTMMDWLSASVRLSIGTPLLAILACDGW